MKIFYSYLQGPTRSNLHCLFNFIVWSEVKITQSYLTLCDTMVSHMKTPWSSPGKNTVVDCHSLLHRIFSNPGIEPRTPALQADSLPSELPGKPTPYSVTALQLPWPFSHFSNKPVSLLLHSFYSYSCLCLEYSPHGHPILLVQVSP